MSAVDLVLCVLLLAGSVGFFAFNRGELRWDDSEDFERGLDALGNAVKGDQG